MSPEHERIINAWYEINEAFTSAGLSTDPRKFREAVASILTDCRPSTKKSGPDCYFTEDQEEGPAERKSTSGKNIKGSYTGQSNQSTWAEQVKYTEKKIKEMKRHYFDLFCPKTGRLLDSWYLTGDKVFEILLTKIKGDFHSPKQKADPRIKGTLCMTEIKKYGTKVI
jgi:hypothetical protein